MAVLPRKWGTGHAPPRAALPSSAHRMSHMPMDHLEGLELSEVILHRALAPARLSPLALRYALTGLHVTFPSPWPCTATPHMGIGRTWSTYVTAMM